MSFSQLGMWWAGPRKHFVVAKKIQQNHMRRQIGGAREWGGNINIKYARNQFIMLAISKREQLGKKVIQKQAATKAPKATKNVHKVLAHSQNPSCNTFSRFCQKLKIMMDVDALRKYWILAQKSWKCSNSFTDLIYFLLTCSICFFSEQLSENLTKK